MALEEMERVIRVRAAVSMVVVGWCRGEGVVVVVVAEEGEDGAGNERRTME